MGNRKGSGQIGEGPCAKGKTKWLEKLAADGNWNSMRILRRGQPKKQGRLKDKSGHLKSTEERANTLADHLEQTQWKVRPVTLTPGEEAPLREALPVKTDPFTELELRKAIQKLSSGKAVKEGDVPVEVFKALSLEVGTPLKWLLDFFNDCWANKEVPTDWSSALVALI